jgi:glutamine synthetase
MGISPESSHHEEGPGQNEIDFRYSDPVTAADNIMTLQTIVKTVANSNGLAADFSPKPLKNCPGNGFHINMSVRPDDSSEKLTHMIAGVLDRAIPTTVFLDPTEDSYKRLGQRKAPRYVSWSAENRSQLVRIPAASKEFRRAELRSPDPTANPYLAFALIIYSCLYGMEKGISLPPEADFNTFSALPEQLKDYKKLPSSLAEAYTAASQSTFIREHIPASVIEAYGR